MSLRGYSIGLPAALVATTLWGFTFLGPAAVAPVNIYYLVVGRYVVFGLMSMCVLGCNVSCLRSFGVLNFLKAMHLGVVGYIGFYLLLSMSASIAGGVLASTLTGLIPALVSVISNSIEKAIEWRRLLVSIIIMSSGLLLMNGGGSVRWFDGNGRGTVVGTVLGLLACLAWVYFVIMNGRILNGSKADINGALWTAGIGFGALFGSLFLIPPALSLSGPSPFSSSATFWPFLLWCAALAVLGSWCATWFWNIAAKRLPTTFLGPIIGAEAVFGVVFNLLWQRRLPTFHEFWGGLLVVGGVFMCAHAFSRARSMAQPMVRSLALDRIYGSSATCVGVRPAGSRQ